MSQAAIKKQIEFYFSDSNYRKDTFLKTAAENDPDGLGFVPISVLLTFNKLKSITTDEKLIRDALIDSTEVVVDEEKSRIRRSKPLPEEDISKLKTLYVKGYPVDDTDLTIDSISEQFSVYGKVVMVRLRRDHTTKLFKGSAFVEFETVESMENAIKLTHKDDNANEVILTYKDKPFVCIMRIEEWLARKKAKFEARKKSKSSVVDTTVESTDKSSSNANVGEKRKLEESLNFTPGLIVKITNLPDDATLFQIKDAFIAISEVKYVEYRTGESEAFMRVASTESSEKIIAALGQGFSLPGSETKLTGSILKDADEIAYWTKINTESMNKKKNSGSRGGRGRFKRRR